MSMKPEAEIVPRSDEVATSLKRPLPGALDGRAADADLRRRRGRGRWCRRPPGTGVGRRETFSQSSATSSSVSASTLSSPAPQRTVSAIPSRTRRSSSPSPPATVSTPRPASTTSLPAPPSTSSSPSPALTWSLPAPAPDHVVAVVAGDRVGAAGGGELVRAGAAEQRDRRGRAGRRRSPRGRRGRSAARPAPAAGHSTWITHAFASSVIVARGARARVEPAVDRRVAEVDVRARALDHQRVQRDGVRGQVRDLVAAGAHERVGVGGGGRTAQRRPRPRSGPEAIAPRGASVLWSRGSIRR